MYIPIQGQRSKNIKVVKGNPKYTLIHPPQDGVPKITQILLHMERKRGRDRDLVSASAS